MTQEELDNSIYWPIRTELASLGHFPDILDYINDLPGFEAAKKAIIASNVMYIEIKNVAAGEVRGEITMNCIVVDRRDSRLGGLGAGFTDIVPSATPDKFDKVQLPENSETVDYVFTVMANTVAEERVIQAIIRRVFSTRKYMPVVNNLGQEIDETFFIKYGKTVDMSGDRMVEKKVMYSVEDVWIQESTVIQTNIPKITQINAELNIGLMPGDQENN